MIHIQDRTIKIDWEPFTLNCMRKIANILFFYLFISVASAQYPADMDNYKVSPDGRVVLADLPVIHMEIPPWVIQGGWYSYIISSGTNSSTVSVPRSLSSGNTLNCYGRGPYFATGPDVNKPWKRNYSEIYSAHSLVHPSAGPVNIAFCHNENKNQCNMQNTINPAITPDCSVHGNDYKAYYAMITAIWTPCDQADNWGQKGYNNDLGPIIWPSVGYVAPDNSSASEGFLQPSSIRVGDSLYIFVWDKGPSSPLVAGREGCTRGIKAIRVAVADCLDPSRYEVYYKDPHGRVQWLPSLPAGFTKENMLRYVRVAGPKATDILSDEIPGNTEAFRFSVAQVAGQHYFIGCEEYVDNNDRSHGKSRHHIALRFSYDLVNWSERKKIIETSDSWDASDFNYPILMDAEGGSNTTIDLNNFYVIGVRSQSPFSSGVRMMNISYSPDVSPYAALMAFSSVGSSLDINNSVIKAYPNPSHGNFILSYSLTSPSQTQVNIFDTRGYKVSSGVAYSKPPGVYNEHIDLSACGNGIYIVELFINDSKKVLKVVRD